MTQELFGGGARNRLDRIGAALRAVHRSLIDVTKRDYERLHGRIGNPYALFSLVAQDPFFAWLQPMTRLIVEIEDAIGRKEPPAGKEDVTGAQTRIEALLTGGKEDFSVRYLDLLQKSPEVATENGALQKVLREEER